jgi:hypothetical protein
MHETPVSTQYSHTDKSRNALVWDYILSFPIKLRDLSIDSLLVLTAWTSDGQVFGGTNLRFFDENGCLKRGKQKLIFYFDTRGDGNVIEDRNNTPGDYYENYSKWDYKFKMEKSLEKYKASQYGSNNTRNNNNNNNNNNNENNNNNNNIEWLDRLVLNRLNAPFSDSSSSSVLYKNNSPTNESKSLNSNFNSNSNLNNLIGDNDYDDNNDNDFKNWGCPLEEIDLQSFCFLIVELPFLPYEVFYFIIMFF